MLTTASSTVFFGKLSHARHSAVLPDHHWLHVSLLLCTCTTLSMLFATSSQCHFVTKLIHRDSIFSPYYNPNYTIYDRSALAMASSMARSDDMNYKASWTTSTTSSKMKADYQAEILPGHLGTLFMVWMSFGEPPVPQLVAMDTGSSALWIQCQPCIKCFYQLEQIFDPAKSSTYMKIPCQFPECTSFPAPPSCDRMNNCQFRVSYMDGTVASGLLVFEQLTIGTSDEGVTKIPNVVIGCGNCNKNALVKAQKKSGQISGVLGLGPGLESLVQKLGKKFSYCIGNIDDLSYPFNQLAMGEAASLDGYSTAMHMGANHDQYLVTLEGISVGEKRLDVTLEAYRRGQWVRADEMMIDTGSTYSYLATQCYMALLNEVAVLMDGILEQVPVGKYELDLCYKGDVGRDLVGFPAITFHLAQGADLVVDTDGMFRQVNKDVFCMAVFEAADHPGLSIIGILAQQYYNVGYDLHQRRIFFQRIDCEVLVS